MQGKVKRKWMLGEIIAHFVLHLMGFGPLQKFSIIFALYVSYKTIKRLSFSPLPFISPTFVCRILSFSLLVAISGSISQQNCSVAGWQIFWKTQSSITCPIHSSPPTMRIIKKTLFRLTMFFALYYIEIEVQMQCFIHVSVWESVAMNGQYKEWQVIMQKSFTGFCNLSYTTGYKERAKLIQHGTFGIITFHHAFESDIHDGLLYQH